MCSKGNFKGPLQKLEDTFNLAKSIIERLQQATLEIHSERSPLGSEKIFQEPVGVQADLTQDHILPALGMAVNQINGTRFRGVIIDYPWAIEMVMRRRTKFLNYQTLADSFLDRFDLS